MTDKAWYREASREKELTAAQLDFIRDCMDQNLEHARHVENERLTFNSIFMAMTGCTLAFIYSLESPAFALALTAVLIMLGFIAMLLTKRWDNTFDRHIEYARECYQAIHEHLLPVGTSGEACNGRNRIEGLNATPIYCFRPRDPEARSRLGKALFRIRTRHLFTAFYILIMLVLLVSAAHFAILMLSAKA